MRYEIWYMGQIEYEDDRNDAWELACVMTNGHPEKASIIDTWKERENYVY